MGIDINFVNESKRLASYVKDLGYCEIIVRFPNYSVNEKAKSISTQRNIISFTGEIVRHSDKFEHDYPYTRDLHKTKITLRFRDITKAEQFGNSIKDNTNILIMLSEINKGVAYETRESRPYENWGKTLSNIIIYDIDINKFQVLGEDDDLLRTPTAEEFDKKLRTEWNWYFRGSTYIKDYIKDKTKIDDAYFNKIYESIKRQGRYATKQRLDFIANLSVYFTIDQQNTLYYERKYLSTKNINP